MFSTSANEMSVANSKVQNELAKKGADKEIADTEILRNLAKHLWSFDSLEFRLRVLLSLALLVGAKVRAEDLHLFCLFPIRALDCSTF